jgi:histone deacetylase 1/2
MQKQQPVVAYYYDEESGNYCYTVNHPWRPHRSKLVHNLVTGYNLEKEMIVHRPRPRTFEEITEFHADGNDLNSVVVSQTRLKLSMFSRWQRQDWLGPHTTLPMALYADYINFMKQVTPETTQEYMTQLKRFNMGSPGESDCPVFDGMYEYFAVRAAQNLVSKLRGMLFHNVAGSC